MALAGCLDGLVSDGPDPSDAPSGKLGNPASATEVDVTTRPMPAFEPEIVHVDPGATVTWTVVDGRHDVTAYHPDTYGHRRIPEGAEPWASQLLTPGQTFTHTFEAEGVYDYVDTRTVCTTHEVVGAIGRVVVGWPDLTGEPALADPPADVPSMAARKLESFNEETRATFATNEP